MRAVVCHRAQLDVTELPDPTAGVGQVLLNVLRCGICGSDLHARHDSDAQADVLAEAGYQRFMRSRDRVVFGHEFSGEIAEYGQGCLEALAPGTRVVALPLIKHGEEIHAIGLSAAAPGGYADLVVVEEALLFAIPNGLALNAATLTEPMAISCHAVRRSEIKPDDIGIVIGCGPVGLGVISLLKASGVRTVVASDPSAGRRSLATACGADLVVDPGEESPFAGSEGRGHITSIAARADLGLATMKQLRRGQQPWHEVWRAAETAGAGPKRPVIFECVGIPGIIDGVITNAPLSSRIVVVGVCTKPDTIRPVMAINKEIDLRFVVGYTPLEFRDTLHMLADGKIDATPLLTGTVGLEGVENAFAALASPEAHAKILIDPKSLATGPELL